MAFFRLLDENAQLSLTNIAVIIVLVKVSLSPKIDAATISALLSVISAYQFKRYVQRSKGESS